MFLKKSTLVQHQDARAERSESWLVALDVGPAGAFYRVAIGLAAIPVMSWLWGDRGSEWALVPFLLTTLMILRVVPAIVRWLTPFSEPVRRTWAARRQMAKRYDAYQWRKLFWIGAGVGLYTALSGDFGRSRIAVAGICLVAGLLGILRWRAIGRQRQSVTSA